MRNKACRPGFRLALFSAVGFATTIPSLPIPQQTPVAAIPPASTVPAQIVAWVRQSAVRLETVEPVGGFQDMNAVQRMVGSARVVALGEATHGSREFFRIKHRIFEFLVKRMGFTIFGIEANWSEWLPINEYVVHGIGDPARLLASTGFWTWKTDEVLDLILWMRAYNKDERHTTKLKFYGFDMQRVGPAAEFLQGYLTRVDPQYAAEIATTLGELRRAEALRSRDEWNSIWRKVKAPVEVMERRLAEKRTSYVARSVEEEWLEASGHARMLRQAVQVYSAGLNRDPSPRDRFMAENLEWIRKREGPNARIVVWAHNGHVMLSGGSMGSQLRKGGVGVVAVGFVFNQGSFRAIDRTPATSRPGDIRPFSVGPAPEGSLDATLAAARIPICLLDLRAAAGAVAEWFHGAHLTREVGAVFSDDASMLQRIVPAEDYDILLFIDRITAARPLGGATPEPRAH